MYGRPRPPQGSLAIVDLARREGIDAGAARNRLRKYFGGTLADLGISAWTCGSEDVDFVLSIIRPSSGKNIAPPNAPPAELEPLRARTRSNASRATCQTSRSTAPSSWPRMSRSDLTLPRTAGVYALFLRDDSLLPGIVPLTEGLIYIGLGRDLLKRCHFSGKTEGHSPRRSLAALLWTRLCLKPELGANGNYKLDSASEKRLDAWMHDNLLMAFNSCGDFEAQEDMLIRQLAPPLNLTKCVQSEQHRAVKKLRKAMLEYAVRAP